MVLVLLARAVQTWKQVLFIVQPETLLRWHREGFRWFWKRKSKVTSPTPKLAPEIIILIKEMAKNNQLWGAERIRGELLKLDIRVCKRTIQKYMRRVRTARPRGQNWATFLRNHAKDVWACDFLQVTDLFFRSLFAFFIIELKSRRVIHVGVTRYPTDAWTAQQLREATRLGTNTKVSSSQRAALRFSKHPIRRQEPMPSVNAFWAVCDESALTTCWSSMRSSCIVSYVPTLSISMRHDHIKGSSSRYRKGK